MGALLGALALWSCAQAPQSFTIKRAPESKPAAEFKQNGYTNYWTAIRHLAIQEARDGWAEAEYQQFTQAVEMQMQGRTFSAEQLLSKLALDAKDEAVRRYALDLLARTFYDQGRWQDILNLPPGSPYEIAQAATIYNGSPLTEYHFGRLRPFLKIAHWSESTTPHLQVKLNGRKVCLMLDSGASRTMISSRVADKCGITPLSEKSFWETGDLISRISAPFPCRCILFGWMEFWEPTY
ncbi:MAG: retropepsin-like aspartic protease [Desulfobacterales bacterium]